MELKPFDIKVMYIACGAVRSNISSNQATRFSLRADSRYTAFLPNIIQRMNASQTTGALPAEEFARQVVRRVLQRNPPGFMTLGGNAQLFRVLGWLPKAWVMWYLWRLFSRPV
ncbi:hypothetical protein DFH06DRAFT_552094 [Mycena polygramma]|nr:hypothetical protein DFH06DRAFT_552094 [Mycena polygramma]